MNFLEQFLELIFEFLILFPLVEFADKMTTSLEDVNAKLQSSMAKVLVVKVRVSPNGNMEEPNILHCRKYIPCSQHGL